MNAKIVEGLKELAESLDLTTPEGRKAADELGKLFVEHFNLRTVARRGANNSKVYNTAYGEKNVSGVGRSIVGLLQKFEENHLTD